MRRFNLSTGLSARARLCLALAFCLATLGLFSGNALQAQEEATARELEFELLARDVARLEPQLGLLKRVARLVSPSVVHIEARGQRSRSTTQEAGSGVLIRIDGQDYVLTNRHVIRNSSAGNVQGRLADGRTVSPQRIWSDRKTDVAVMAIDGARVLEASLDSQSLGSEPLVPAVVGDSTRLEIGEHVLAFGSPFGLSQSVTRGIISAKGRHNLDLGGGAVDYQNFLQTDAAINPGNSGGPLVNLRGEVVGLNTAIASSSGGNEGIGFSIPINIAHRIAVQLVTEGRALRGFLGVSLDGRYDERTARSMGLPRLVGARVTAVQSNSPAESAALQEDDIILSYDGVEVQDDDHLITLVGLTEPERRVEVDVFRNGARVRTLVEIGSRVLSDD